MFIAPATSVISKMHLDNSPDALTRDARRYITDFGYTAKPADTVWGLTYSTDYFNWTLQHPAEAAARWRNPGEGMPPLVKFWYRESPQPISAIRQYNVIVNYNDPPMEQSGLIRLETDPDGRLVTFEAVPQQVEKAGLAPAAPFDWNRLFQAAGLDPAGFQPAEPLWTPLASWDARAAWTRGNLRLEAAAWRGRPVFFHIIGPWTKGGRMSGAGGGNQWPFMVLLYACLIAACTLGWHNLRSGKADPRGALHLCGLYAVCMAAADFLLMHHTANQNEINGFWMTVSTSLLNASLICMFYVALEPWVRRKWPRTIISWTRYSSKGVRDPLVGRDLLYGACLGTLLTLLDAIATLLHGNNGQPATPPLDALMGVRNELAGVLGAPTNAIFIGLLFFFLLFLFQLALKKEWIAAALLVAVMTLATTLSTTTPLVDYPLNVLAYAIMALALLRYGLLAVIIASACDRILRLGGVLDFGTWYAGMAVIPYLLIAGMAIYGFRVSLGGRMLFKPEG
jgi:serine/threonine-protein kinase